MGNPTARLPYLLGKRFALKITVSLTRSWKKHWSVRMAGRRMLPHDAPSWIDPEKEIYFLTVNTAVRGRAQLTVPTVAAAILATVEFRYRHRQWHPWLFLVMPDHCHALMTFPAERQRWVKTVRDWKHWLAAQFAIGWQIDFFDHRLRADESFSGKAEYILQNPVRAGLVSTSEEWPHRWSAPDGPPFTGFQR